MRFGRLKPNRRLTAAAPRVLCARQWDRTRSSGRLGRCSSRFGLRLEGRARPAHVYVENRWPRSIPKRWRARRLPAEKEAAPRRSDPAQAHRGPGGPCEGSSEPRALAPGCRGREWPRAPLKLRLLLFTRRFADLLRRLKTGQYQLRRRALPGREPGCEHGRHKQAADTCARARARKTRLHRPRSVSLAALVSSGPRVQGTRRRMRFMVLASRAYGYFASSISGNFHVPSKSPAVGL
jgi:hypothetical protein